jgi:hypothetical protein
LMCTWLLINMEWDKKLRLYLILNRTERWWGRCLSSLCSSVAVNWYIPSL